MSEPEVVIAAAARTPVGAFGGGLSSLPAHDLGGITITEALNRAGVDPADVSEVIMGQILAPAPGKTRPARPPSGPAFRSTKPPTASISFAGRGCAPWPSAHRPSSSATARSSSPAARKT